jgi:hypothetical protein
MNIGPRILAKTLVVVVSGPAIGHPGMTINRPFFVMFDAGASEVEHA